MRRGSLREIERLARTDLDATLLSGGSAGGVQPIPRPEPNHRESDGMRQPLKNGTSRLACQPSVGPGPR